MRVTLMHNPTAGNEHPPGRALLAALEQAGYEAEYQSTDKKDFARALEDPGELVVVAGGDGTVAKVARHLLGRGIPMAILPLGTANNISKALGVTGPPEQLIAGWASAGRKPFDVGVAKGPWGERHFIEAVGFGLFPRLISLSKEEAAPSGDVGRKLHHDLHLLEETLSNYPAREWQVVLDGEVYAGRYVLLEVMNIGTIGPNLHLAPEADPGDGHFDVAFLTEAGRDAFARYVTSRLAGHEATPDLSVRRARHLEVFSEKAEVHIDDKVWPEEDRAAKNPASAEIEISLQPHALEFLV